MARAGRKNPTWTNERIRQGVGRRLRQAAPSPRPPKTATPATLREWVQRGAFTSRWFGFPLQWTMRSDVPFADPSRVAVIVHVYYPELLPAILHGIGRIPVPFDLIVTNASAEEIDVPSAGLPNLQNCAILPIENHGRDIYPLMALVNADLLNPYDLILKVHTKRSAWRAGHGLQGDGDQWRDALLTALVGSEERIRDILASFASDERLGVVTAPGSVLGPEYWGDNQPMTAELLRRLELDIDEAGLTFAAGSMYWARAFVLQGLRGLGMTRDDFPREAGQVNATTAHAMERLIGAVTTEAGLRIVQSTDLPGTTSRAWDEFTHRRALKAPVDVVPFYLPQFHEVDQNNKWWGPGFTEWTNVAAGRPVFLGQHQPKLPRDLGFYDLHSPWVMPRQEELAASYGVTGFMYYHYWFAGESILHDPIRTRMERVGGLPFCIMWANENWTRRWDGGVDDLLMRQDYNRVPAVGFIHSILDALEHPDYLRVGGRPVLSVYRPVQIPDLAAVVSQWRAAARSRGVGDLLLLAVDRQAAFGKGSNRPEDYGFDGFMSFPPHNLLQKRRRKAGMEIPKRFAGSIFEYRALVKDSLDQLARRSDEALFPGVLIGFDNTARRPDASDVWYGANPYSFRRWLAAILEEVMERPRGQRLVFINAWNEWAEGAVLEPTDKFGLAHLQAVRDALLSLEHRG